MKPKKSPSHPAKGTEKDKGYGASHGYGPGHGGPSGPGDVPGDRRPGAEPAHVPVEIDDELTRPSEKGPGEA